MPVVSRRPLTARQAEVLDVIRRSIDERGYPPTVREIGVAIGIKSTNGVVDHLRALERKGYVTRADGAKSRGSTPVGARRTCPTCGGTGQVLAEKVGGAHV